MIRNYDNADLGIVSLLLIAIGALAYGYVEQGLITACVGAIAGIARPSGNGNGNGNAK